MSNVAVRDIGKTDVELPAAMHSGAIVETVSTANVSSAGAF